MRLEATDHRLIARLGKEVHHTAGDLLADLVRLHQHLDRGLRQRVDRGMRVGQLGRDVLPHAAYPKGEKHSGVRHLLRELQTVTIVLRALLGEALEAHQVGRSHVVQVRGIADEAGVIKCFDRLGADVDVHGPTADKVHDPTLHLRRAAPLVRAVMRRLTLHAHQRCTALRTLADERDRCAIH